MTRHVLEAGAKVDHINSVGRTAAQMAAFVGKSVSCDVKTSTSLKPKSSGIE